MRGKRIRFAPDVPCLCGASFAEHQARVGWGERPGRPPKVHCPAGKSWIRKRPDGSASRQYHFVSALGPGLPAGGPWRILDDCAAPQHNTVRATESVDNPCICPRARHLISHRSHARGKNPLTTFVVPAEHSVRPPDLRGGICTRESVREIVDGGFNTEGTAAAMDTRLKAKNLCRSCPLLEVCRSYVLAAESPAGSWGGVWGGMDPWDRQGKQVVIGLDGIAVLVDV